MMTDIRLLTASEIRAAYRLYESAKSVTRLDVVTDYVLVRNFERYSMPPLPTIEKFVSLGFLICVPRDPWEPKPDDEDNRFPEWDWSGEFRYGSMLTEFFVDPDWKWWSPSLKPGEWTAVYKKETGRSITTNGIRLWREKGKVIGHPESDKAGVRLHLSSLEQKLPRYVAEIRAMSLSRIETQSKLTQTESTSL